MSQAMRIYNENVGHNHEHAVECVWKAAFQEGINAASRPSVAASYAPPVIPDLDVAAFPNVEEDDLSPKVFRAMRLNAGKIA